MTTTRTKASAGAKLRATGLRFHQVHGDLMDPTIRNRDFVLLAPVDRYIGEGYYLIGGELGERILSCNGFGGTKEEPKINLRPHNKFYRGHSLPRADFDEQVLGKVAMICHVVDHALLPTLEGLR